MSIEMRLHERMPGDYSTLSVEHDGVTYLVLTGTGGECAFAYDVDDIEDLLAESDIEIDYSADFCARLVPIEDRDLAIFLAAKHELRLSEGLTDEQYRLVRAEQKYLVDPTQGPDSNYTALLAACDELISACPGSRSRTCQHHSVYPDADYCLGEPSQYCEDTVAYAMRLLRAA